MSSMGETWPQMTCWVMRHGGPISHTPSTTELPELLIPAHLPPPHSSASSGLNSSTPILDSVFQFCPCPHGWPHPNLYSSDSSMSLFISGFCQIPDQTFRMPPEVSLANSHSTCLKSDSLPPPPPQEMVPLSLVSYVVNGITISWQLITHQTWESLWISAIQ